MEGNSDKPSISAQFNKLAQTKTTPVAQSQSPVAKSQSPAVKSPSNSPKLSPRDGSKSPKVDASKMGKSLSSQFSTVIPPGFFQSKQDIRLWGAEHIADPSIQPKPSGLLPELLPGYGPEQVRYLKSLNSPQNRYSSPFVSLAPPGGIVYTPKVFPILSMGDIPFVEIAYPKDIQQLSMPQYAYQDLSSYKMDNTPYINAVMSPQDGTHMYRTANMLTGYPYGVPAVEENEAAVDQLNSTPCLFHCF